METICRITLKLLTTGIKYF